MNETEQEVMFRNVRYFFHRPDLRCFLRDNSICYKCNIPSFYLQDFRAFYRISLRISIRVFTNFN